MELLQILLIIKNDIIDREHRHGAPGICPMVTRISGYNSRLIRQMTNLIERWPEHSGIASYPVPHPRGDRSPQDAYHKTHNLWDINTAYGRKRRELLDWLIEELQHGRG